MSNHLKVLLLDPKWKQQKDALLERARKESAFADDVEANLAAFVTKRHLEVPALLQTCSPP
eukprot:6177289-Amphidinium_carterae.1